MDLFNSIRVLTKDLGGPERMIEIVTPSLEFGGEGSIDDKSTVAFQKFIEFLCSDHFVIAFACASGLGMVKRSRSE
jgi:hypothetical protein